MVPCVILWLEFAASDVWSVYSDFVLLVLGFKTGLLNRTFID
jgi:hypothetical protein